MIALLSHASLIYCVRCSCFVCTPLLARPTIAPRPAIAPPPPNSLLTATCVCLTRSPSQFVGVMKQTTVTVVRVRCAAAFASAAHFSRLTHAQLPRVHLSPPPPTRHSIPQYPTTTLPPHTQPHTPIVLPFLCTQDGSAGPDRGWVFCPGGTMPFSVSALGAVSALGLRGIILDS